MASSIPATKPFFRRYLGTRAQRTAYQIPVESGPMGGRLVGDVNFFTEGLHRRQFSPVNRVDSFTMIQRNSNNSVGRIAIDGNLIDDIMPPAPIHYGDRRPVFERDHDTSETIVTLSGIPEYDPVLLYASVTRELALPQVSLLVRSAGRAPGPRLESRTGNPKLAWTEQEKRGLHHREAMRMYAETQNTESEE
jgi:hypothetical protein